MIEQELDHWEDLAFAGEGIAPGEMAVLLPKVVNQSDRNVTLLVAVILGTVKWEIWSTEPTMALHPYPGATDAAAVGEFAFREGEERECPLDFTVPEEAPHKLYAAWVMVFEGEERVAERKFLDAFPIGA